MIGSHHVSMESHLGVIVQDDIRTQNHHQVGLPRIVSEITSSGTAGVHGGVRQMLRRRVYHVDRTGGVRANDATAP
jgi:hypothetical protein